MTTIQVFDGPGAGFRLVEHPIPTVIRPGEVLVEITLATLCGSDLHTVDGRRREPTPSVLGHEAVGRVVGLGSGRDPRLLNRRVTWTLADSCGRCPACLDWDLPQKCESLFKYGHAPLSDGSGLNGCYARHIVLRPGTSIFEVPDRLADKWVAPANCALATMVAAVEKLRGPCRLAVVQGAGLLGLYCCALLKVRGVERIIVVDVDPIRLELATQFGGEGVLASALERCPPGTADAVFEVTGSAAVIHEGLQLLRPGGHYIWVGMVHPGASFSLSGETVVRRCAKIEGVHNYAPRHLAGAIRFLSEQAERFPWDSLVSPPIALAGLDQAFDLARTRRWPRVSVAP